MQWQTNPYFIPMIVAGFITLVCALFVAQRGNRVAGSTSLLGLIITVCIWAFAYSFELVSAELNWQVFWAKVEYLGIPFVPLFFFIFAYEFSQNLRRLSRRDIALLSVPAFIFLLLAWTNEYHELIWNRIGQKDMGEYFLLSLDHGIAFWLLIAYSYLLLFLGSMAVVRRVINSPTEFKNQSFIILAGAGITWLGNIIYISGLSPVPDLDLTPISFMISSVIFSLGLFRFGMLDIMPIAGESILESMDDIVMVINARENLVFINRAFDYYFRVSPSSLMGKPAMKAFARWPLLQALVDSSNTIRKEITIAPADRSPFIFDVRVFSVRLKAEQTIGRVIMLSDVTERRSAESRVSQQQLQDVGSAEIPLMVMYRLSDDKIVDVNRTFLVNLRYERKNVLGRSLLDIMFWDSYQRADFLRAVYKSGSLHDYALRVGSSNGSRLPYVFSASQLEIQGGKYIVMIAQESSLEN